MRGKEHELKAEFYTYKLGEKEIRKSITKCFILGNGPEISKLPEVLRVDENRRKGRIQTKWVLNARINEKWVGHYSALWRDGNRRFHGTTKPGAKEKGTFFLLRVSKNGEALQIVHFPHYRPRSATDEARMAKHYHRLLDGPNLRSRLSS